MKKNFLRKIACLILCFAFHTHFLNSEAYSDKGIFSFELNLFNTRTELYGWGFGAGYEFNIFNMASVKPVFSSKIFKPSFKGDWITTVGLGIDVRYYPFHTGLDWLFVGYGFSTDFIVKEGEKSQTYISHIPHIGWKQNFWNWAMLELTVGYRFPVKNVDESLSCPELANNGFEFNIICKLNLRKIFRF